MDESKKVNVNKNTEYELFTQEIYQQLVNADVLKPTKVQHNIKLLGKSGQKHQIDVYWEYEIAGVMHKVAIECKNYSTRVSVGKVRDFCSVLNDLNNVAGIMVTKVGYQKGAKQFGFYNDINLKELRTPNAGEAIIATAEITIGVKARHTFFKIDTKWAEEQHFNIQMIKELLSCIDMTENQKWLHSDYVPLDFSSKSIVDSSYKIITTLDKLEKNLPDKKAFEFDDAYIMTRSWGLVKIKEIKYEDEKHTCIHDIKIDGKKIVKAILKDAINGEIKMFGK